jgi:hypothetical protein
VNAKEVPPEIAVPYAALVSAAGLVLCVPELVLGFAKKPPAFD